MRTHKLLDFPIDASPIPNKISDSVNLQGVRDQNGLATAVIFTSAAAVPDYFFEVQGAAEDLGASTVWHTLVRTGKGTGLSDIRINDFSFTVEFPLMPVMRFIFNQTDTVNGYRRVEAWLVE